MNPNDVPVKFPLHTRVKVIKGINVGYNGTIIEERRDGKNNHVSFDNGGHAYFSDYELEALPVPEVGDLVKVKAYGKWQAHEGHIISKNTGTFSVDFGYEEKAAFGADALEVIEKVKPKPVRIEGQPIKPEAIKRGDKISVVNVEEHEIKRTTILEAIVDKIIPKGFYGDSVELQTRTGAKIYSNVVPNNAVISLVADIDKDVDFHALSLIKPNEIIGFPDEEGGAEINIAVRQERDWSVLLGAKKSKNMETAGLVAILKKKNVTFSIIRSISGEPEFPFEKGQHVKVSSKFNNGQLSAGDYRVIIPGKEVSTIKSRGISAATHDVPNHYLLKD